MKVFISSVIQGLEDFREAAARAARVLKHEVKRAEDFGALPQTPQQACLAGVRWGDVVVLVLGNRYGTPQASGVSATHEEYREARGEREVLAFVLTGAEPEAQQSAFIQEVREWATGTYTSQAGSPEELRDEVTRALRDLELARAVGPVDEAEMLERARSLLPDERAHVYGEPSLTVVVVGGPRREILRPAEIEDAALERDLLQEALFGAHAVMSPEYGTAPRVEGDALILQQEGTIVTLDQLGSIRVTLPAGPKRNRLVPELPVVIEEEIRERISMTLRFAATMLERVDPLRRLSDVALLVVLNRGSLGWRTRAEHEQSPNSGEMSMGPSRLVVSPSPARRHRAALAQDFGSLSEDLTLLLRRGAKAR